MLTMFLAAALAQSTAGEPVPAEIHNFADWAVACDNGLTCAAVSLVPEDPPEPPAGVTADPWERFGTLRLSRAAGPDAALVVTIASFEGQPARLTANGNVVDARIEPVGEGAWRIVPANPAAFVMELYSGTMVAEDMSGRTIGEFALSGAQDALVYMEERQGRLRTQGALARPGRRPNSLVPAAPALPVVQAAPASTERPLTIPARRMAEARRQFGCTVDEVGVTAEEVSTHALGGGRTLVLMGCGSGAYNASSAVLVAWQEGGAIRIEAAPVDVSQEQEGAEGSRPFMVVNGGFDAASGALGSWAKGRGLGDCGVASTYRWDGARFRLVRQDAMSVCRGSRELLTTWRAEVR